MYKTLFMDESQYKVLMDWQKKTLNIKASMNWQQEFILQQKKDQ